VEDGSSQTALRAALVVAAVAALIILAGLFGDAVRYVCLGLIVLAALFCAGERRQPAGGACWGRAPCSRSSALRWLS
jgi:hypothetical protein